MQINNIQPWLVPLQTGCYIRTINCKDVSGKVTTALKTHYVRKTVIYSGINGAVDFLCLVMDRLALLISDQTVPRSILSFSSLFLVSLLSSCLFNHNNANLFQGIL